MNGTHDFLKKALSDPNHIRTEFIPNANHAGNPTSALLNDLMWSSIQAENSAFFRSMLMGGVVIPSLVSYGLGKVLPENPSKHHILTNPLQWGEDRVRPWVEHLFNN
jgi:hypothetical protein